MHLKKAIPLINLLLISALIFISCSGGNPPFTDEFPKETATVKKQIDESEHQLKSNTLSYGGEWKRTEVIRGAGADLSIYNETDGEFHFRLTAFWGDHFGDISGIAEKVEGNNGFFNIEANANHGGGVLNFHINEKSVLILSYEGDSVALDFGQNVIPDGTYTLDEPIYESDHYPLLVFGSEKMIDKVKALMVETNEFDDETAFLNLLTVMTAGIPEIAEPGRYKGYLPPGRSMEVDLIVTADDHVHILAHNLDERPYVFYTTHITYFGQDIYPEGLDIPSHGEIEPVYHPGTGLGD